MGPDGSVYVAESFTVRRIASDGRISSFAGTGSVNFSGDGVPALTAGVPIPRGLITDGDGNLYLISADRVRRIGLDGIIRTVAGTGTRGFSGDGGPATRAQLNASQGLAVDSAGNIYVADGNNGRVRKIDPRGNISTVAGGGTNSGAGGFPATLAALNFVGSVDIAAAGNLYLTEGPRVRKVDSSGNITTLAQVTFFGGSAVRADRAGNVLFTDIRLGLVRRVDAAGQVTPVAGNGRFRSFPEGTPAALAFIKASSFVVVSPDGLLHYSDDRRVRRVERDGGVITVAGTDWNSASTCRASRPPPPRQMRVD